MTSVEENGTAHDQTTKPDVDCKMAGNHSICVQQLKQEIKNLMRSEDYGHPGNMPLSSTTAPTRFITSNSVVHSSTRLIGNSCILFIETSNNA